MRDVRSKDQVISEPDRGRSTPELGIPSTASWSQLGRKTERGPIDRDGFAEMKHADQRVSDSASVSGTLAPSAEEWTVSWWDERSTRIVVCEVLLAYSCYLQEWTKERI